MPVDETIWKLLETGHFYEFRRGPGGWGIFIGKGIVGEPLLVFPTEKQAHEVYTRWDAAALKVTEAQRRKRQRQGR